MKEFILYDSKSATTVNQGLDNLIRVFNDLEEIAETVNYSDDGDRDTYKEYVKSLRSYYERCEKLLLDEKNI